jgi:hypothetical protein
MIKPARPDHIARAEARLTAVLVSAGASDNTYTCIVAEDIVGEYLASGNVTALGIIRQAIGDNLADALVAAHEAETVSA